ncbi:hypothetical protein H4R33_003309 [Dimargaris cristalligena]|uniref:G-protein coupled receptors family 3 profile domain-containing protein n=1 Tax=Dimargaris cristalligena TaxID=215637 RepID=A0A4V1J5C0_9FUNG|nr:hypothetical protein H4R33_003309 [Dimargaris cristalligena]RKP38529.1 hypothetical protein BJ085DRAFT_40431 [Dimargaris cristalligena]|eukprot:RKP38529.1 hypothetical protein BJ085DRAFT_40431 [Dimargaris cristalligena]
MTRPMDPYYDSIDVGEESLAERSIPIDIAVLSLGCIVFAIDLVAFLYILANRNYPPLKAKNIGVMGAALLSALFWWLGDSHVNGLFGAGDGILGLCLMWGLWLRHVLGIMTHLIIINYRLHLLNWVFNKRRSTRGWKFYVPVVVVAIPVMVLGIIAVALPRKYTLDYSVALKRCKHNGLIKYMCFSYSVFLILLIWVQSFVLRNIKSSFNEFRQILPACIGATLIVGINASFVLSKLHHKIPSRAILGVCNLIACQLFFWFIMGPAIWGCLFHREAYLGRFYNALQRDGLRQSLNPSGYKAQSSSTGLDAGEKKRIVSLAGTTSTTATNSNSPPFSSHHHYPNQPQHHLHLHRISDDNEHPPPFSLGTYHPTAMQPWMGYPHYSSDVALQVVPISPATDTFHHNDPQDMFVLVPTRTTGPPPSHSSMGRL